MLLGLDTLPWPHSNQTIHTQNPFLWKKYLSFGIYGQQIWIESHLVFKDTRQ